MHKELDAIAGKVIKGVRITSAEGISLYENGEVGYLGWLADKVRERKNGDKAYFNRNFHIEPTNLCVFDCKFCSYSRSFKNPAESWTMSKEQMLEIVRSYEGKPVTEVHIVGGVHPKLNLAFFEDLFRSIKELRPELHIKGLTAVEYEHIFRKAGVSWEEGFHRLIEAGLGSIPGGGAEIFDEEIREQICADKATSEQWLGIHEAAHRLGLHSNATILYGHIESYAHRIDHMERLRKLQDKTGKFNTFIPLKFRNADNQMSYLKEVSVIEDMKNYAVSRIFLDNFGHIKAYWPMIGREKAQLSLSFGVDDIDGTIDDSTKIYSMAGSEEQHPVMTTPEIVNLIKSAGRRPVERDTLYNTIRDYSEVESTLA